MGTLFFLLFLITGFGFLLGMLKPKLVLRWSSNPTRKQVFIYYFLTSIFCLVVFYSNYESSFDRALKDPVLATELSLRNEKLDNLPMEALQFSNLVDLNLSKNMFSTIPVEIKEFTKLEYLDLSDNPIEEIPNWLFEMESLYRVKLNNTLISSIPAPKDGKDITFIYENTPLSKSEKSVEQEKNTSNLVEEKNSEVLDTEPSKSTKEDRTASFGEFAFRSILGNDYGFKRKFGKGELYYNEPATIEEADAIGEVLETMGLFNDKNNVSMLLDKSFDDNDSALFVLKMVVNDADEIDSETIQTFKFLRQMISASALESQMLHIHLTNGEFETQEVLKP